MPNLQNAIKIIQILGLKSHPEGGHRNLASSIPERRTRMWHRHLLSAPGRRNIRMAPGRRRRNLALVCRCSTAPVAVRGRHGDLHGDAWAGHSGGSASPGDRARRGLANGGEHRRVDPGRLHRVACVRLLRIRTCTGRLVPIDVISPLLATHGDQDNLCSEEPTRPGKEGRRL